MDSLTVETEDSLFEFIKAYIISHDSSFLDLLSHINLSFLSSSRISKFLELLLEIIPNLTSIRPLKRIENLKMMIHYS
jgi:hypothetical protein